MLNVSQAAFATAFGLRRLFSFNFARTQAASGTQVVPPACTRAAVFEVTHATGATCLRTT